MQVNTLLFCLFHESDTTIGIVAFFFITSI